MRVTFDSNVWRIVASPETFPNEKSITEFKAIKQAIQQGAIIPCLSETIFTLEAIEKDNRWEFLARYNFTINISEAENDNGGVGISLSIKPTTTGHLGNNPYLSKHLKDALDLGFKIMRCPRIGGMKNPDIQESYYIVDKDLDKHKRQETFGKCTQAIEHHGCGIKHIKDIGTKHDKHFWLDGIKKVSESEKLQIIKAVAEWADGDAISAHVAYENKYFCTRDFGKSGGTNSILSKQNREWLRPQYNIEFLTPEELARKIVEW